MQTHTIVVSAFPGCGKTYAFTNQKTLGFTCIDSDSSKFNGHQDWETEYVDHIISLVRKNAADFVFVSQHESVLRKLNEAGIHFVKVIPDKSLKEEYFERYKNRKNDHIKNLDGWLKLLDTNWDAWTSEDNMKVGNPKEQFFLQHNQYLVDILRILKKK